MDNQEGLDAMSHLRASNSKGSLRLSSCFLSQYLCLIILCKATELLQSGATPCPLSLSVRWHEMAGARRRPGREAALEEGWVCGEVNTTAESSSESHQRFQQAI